MPFNFGTVLARALLLAGPALNFRFPSTTATRIPGIWPDPASPLHGFISGFHSSSNRPPASAPPAARRAWDSHRAGHSGVGFAATAGRRLLIRFRLIRELWPGTPPHYFWAPFRQFHCSRRFVYSRHSIIPCVCSRRRRSTTATFGDRWLHYRRVAFVAPQHLHTAGFISRHRRIVRYRTAGHRIASHYTALHSLPQRRYRI